jgi:hypothetical protein
MVAPVQRYHRSKRIMLNEPAHISIVSTVPVVGVCELCATDAAELTAAVLVQHSRGGRVQLAACDRCARAVRRVAAAAGEQAQFSREPEVSAISTRATRRKRPPVVKKVVERVVEMVTPEIMYEYPEHIRDADGTECLVRVYGAPRSDGIWEGWAEFLGIGVNVVRRTDIETTQSNREDLAYWATGLEGTYFEGAFRRTHPVPAA